MKLTKERRKQFFNQYRWIYALPNGICLLLFIYGNQMIAQHYGFDRQGAWMTWGQFLAVGLVVWLAGRVVDAVLGRYAHQWGGCYAHQDEPMGKVSVVADDDWSCHGMGV